MKKIKTVAVRVKPKISGPYSHNLVWESPDEREQCRALGYIVPFDGVIMADPAFIRVAILKWFSR